MIINLVSEESSIMLKILFTINNNGLTSKNTSVIMNLMTISSSDLFRYDGGALGLTKYKDESTGERITFLTLEDPALEAGRNAAVYAFIVGLLYISMSTIHHFVARIPYCDILLSILGAVIQLCFLVVYVAKDNGICEVEGCSWGSGATWLFMSEILMLSASVGSLYASEHLWIRNKATIRTVPIHIDKN